jgi:hypothetical protein
VAEPVPVPKPAREPRTSGGPWWGALKTQDLFDPLRIAALYRQCCKLGYVADGSERDVLNFVGAACHARRVGKSPPKLMAWIIRQGKWGVITERDEKTALAVIARARGR